MKVADQSVRELMNGIKLAAIKKASVITLLGRISLQADKILLWQFLGPNALATYTVALGPILQCQGWFKSLESLAFPKMASTHTHILKKTLPTKLVRMLIVIIPAVSIYIMLAPTLYGLFLPQYLASVPYSQALALSLLFLPQQLLDTMLRAKSQKQALYIITTTNQLARLLLLFLLVPVYGMWGAVVAFFLPTLFNLFVMTYFFRKM